MKVVPKKWKRFYLKDQTMGFFPQTQNLEPPRADIAGGCRGVRPPPSTPQDELRLSNKIVILQKKRDFVVYWFWGKTWDEVEEFMLNALKLAVKMVGL